jgi:hypothetical protein
MPVCGSSGESFLTYFFRALGAAKEAHHLTFLQVAGLFVWWAILNDLRTETRA